MNQMLADLFLALPRTLTEPRVFGSVCLGLCWLGYIFFMRAPSTKSDRGGVYALRSASLLLLAVTTIFHALLFWLDLRGHVVASVADRVLLSMVVTLSCALYLWVQPGATVERRLRWGFTKRNAVVHAVVWEAVMVLVLLLLLYDAWFFPLFV